MSFHGEVFAPLSVRGVAEVAMQHILKKEGFTIGFDGGQPPTEGWAVSLAGYETIFDNRPSDRRLTLSILHKMRETPPGCYLGGWYDNGKYYLDVSTVIADYDEAMSFASDNNQKAIFNVGTGETVYLSVGGRIKPAFVPQG